MATLARAAPATAGRTAVAVTLACGVGLGAQSRVNGELGERLGHPVVAGLVSFGVGLVAVAVLLLARPPAAGALRSGLRRLPRWTLLVGCAGAVLITVSAAAAPVVGVSVLTVGLVAGQATGGLLADRSGIGPIGVVPLSPARVGGAGLCLLAVALTLVGAGTAPTSPLLAAAILVAGLLTAVQGAGLGRLRSALHSAELTALVNFLGGAGALVLAVAALALAGQLGAADWPGPSEWWLYTGGVIGVSFVLVASVVVRLIGVLRFGLAAVAGQLIGALVLDLLLPTARGLPSLSWVAAALTLVAVWISGRGPRPAVAPGPADRAAAR